MIDSGTVEQQGLPGHLRSVPDEIDAKALPVTGTLPPELNGRYIRNGPNALPGQTSTQFQIGPGMLHGVRLREGRAEWYRNRWVRTGAFHGRPFAGPGGIDRTAVSANTNIVRHARRMYALVEMGLPFEVTPELDTVGPGEFGGRLANGMTAHPKRDPLTGELHFFGYGMRPPYLTYHRVDAGGELAFSREVPVRAGTMMHDFTITERYAVWLDLPVTFHPDLIGRGVPYRWDENYGARLGLMRRDVPDAPVRWFEIDPCFVFHVGGAYEDASGRVVLDAVRYSPAEFTSLWGLLSRTAPLTGPGARAGRAMLHRWTLDPSSGRATEEGLDTQEVEFPTLDETRIGRRTRYLYTVTGTDPRSTETCAIIKYDIGTGTGIRYQADPDTVVGEAVFVPVGGDRREDDGWLLSIVTRRDGSASRLLVLDASDVAAGPVAAVELPRAVPTGFHGAWFPDL